MPPLLSIITVNLNNASGLQKTIGSVVNQTFNDFEFIVVDGGSTDGSVEVIRNNSSKITHWVSEPDNGIYHAMNKGIAMASGTYCLFINSGDALADNLVLQDFADSQPAEELIYGDTIFMYPNGNQFRKPAIEKITLQYLIDDDINHQSCFIKRILFDKAGNYDETLRIAADHKFFLNIFLYHKVTYRYVKRVMSIYDMSGISARNVSLQMEERALVQSRVIPSVVAELYKQYSLLRTREYNSLMARFQRIVKRIRKYFNT